MAEDRLGRQAARAFGWIAVSKGVERVLGVARITVLARLLAPDDFGAFGVALLALGTVERLSRPGLGIALVQRAEDVRPYLDAVWTVLLLRAWGIALLLYLSREAVASFFGTPEAADLLVGVSIATAIGGLTSVGLTLLQRELRLGRRAAALGASSVADLVVTIPLAFALRDPMALVYGMIARNGVLVVASWMAHPYRPRPTLNWRPLRELREFAVQGAAHSFLFFIVEQGDDAFVGKVLGDAALGVYLVTYRVANILTQEVARMLAEVTLPVFSRVQDDSAKLAQAIREALGATLALVLPLSLFLALTAYPFIEFFLGEAWLEGVPAFRVLLAFGVLRAMSQVMEAALIARGEMAYLTRMLIVQLAVAVAVVVPLGLTRGLPGVAVGIAASQAVAFLISAQRMSDRTGPGGTGLGLLGAARGPVAGGLLGLAAAAALLPVLSVRTDSAFLLLAGSGMAFAPLYLAVAFPLLRRDVPAVMEVTVDRWIRRFRRTEDA